MVGPSLLPWRGGVGVDGGGAAWWGPPFFPGVLFLFFFEKKVYRVFFGHSTTSLPSARQKTLGKLAFAVNKFVKCRLPSVTLGKSFAECFLAFAECPWHSAKFLNPVVSGGHGKEKDIAMEEEHTSWERRQGTFWVSALPCPAKVLAGQILAIKSPVPNLAAHGPTKSAAPMDRAHGEEKTRRCWKLCCAL